MKRPFRGMPWGTVALGALLLLAATPPAWGSWAPFLCVPGLAVQFQLARGERRPLLASYWLGALHIGAFSWSLRHVTYGGWVAIAAIGGLYHLAVAMATRRAQRWRQVTFALAVAGAAWLRAEMPGIAYPHGQPCHGFWQWPTLLGAVALGGEPLANALLAGLGSALAEAATAWRVAVPSAAAARRALGGWILSALALTVLGARSAPADGAPSVAVAAIEPGLHPVDAYADLPRADRDAYERRFRELFEQRLLAPTASVAGRNVASPPDLVLWPESSVPFPVEEEASGRRRFPDLEGALSLAPGTCVCLGTDVERARRYTPAAVLVDARGAYRGHQEKRHLVPAGETLPLIELLPASMAASVRAWLQTAVGLPAALPGRSLPPLELPARGGGAPVLFAALVCYDNAFPDGIADAVAAGARFVAVLSNEAWYRGGGEVEQLAAITVLRAVAADVPIVRCTTDGRSMAVGRDGRLLAALPPAPAPTPAARILRVDLPLGPGRLPAMARLHPWFGAASALALLAACLHGALRRAKLLRLGRATAGGRGRSAESLTGGS